MKNTQITNLLTQEKTFFCNDYSLTENIVSKIILDRKQAGQLLNEAVRNEIKNSLEIVERISGMTGNLFGYCTELHLHAKVI